ncbi:MAG: sigma-70 family RNA polymerase sigma factor [Verrucomicrobiota bacterium]
MELTSAQPKMRIYLAKLLANSSSTDDVLQEANKVIWTKRADWDPTTPFLKWGYRICYFQAKAFLRDQQRDKLVFREELLDLLASEVPKEAPLQKLEETLILCLRKLDLAKRKLVLNHYDPDVSFSSLALEQGITPNALSQKLRRIRHRLRQCMESSLSPHSTP